MRNVLGLALRSCGLMLVVAALGGLARASDHLPEVDPSTMGSAVALLTGTVMLVTGRRRSK